jgi:hypothetical protein
MATSVEPLAPTRRLKGVRLKRCEKLLRLSGSIYAATQSADYAAGHADALADNARHETEERDAT